MYPYNTGGLPPQNQPSGNYPWLYFQNQENPPPLHDQLNGHQSQNPQSTYQPPQYGVPYANSVPPQEEYQGYPVLKIPTETETTPAMLFFGAIEKLNLLCNAQPLQLNEIKAQIIQVKQKIEPAKLEDEDAASIHQILLNGEEAIEEQSITPKRQWFVFSYKKAALIGISFFCLKRAGREVFALSMRVAALMTFVLVLKSIFNNMNSDTPKDKNLVARKIDQMSQSLAGFYTNRVLAYMPTQV